MALLLIWASLVLCSTANDIQQPDVRHEGEVSAFSVASYSSFGPVSTDTNIPFSVIETNFGDGWSGITNSFTAPIDGAFLFAASIGSILDANCTASIVVFHQQSFRKVASLTSSSWASVADANEVILTLSMNDQVSVQLHAFSGQTFSSPEEVFVTFSGIQLSNSDATPLHENDPVGFSVRDISGFGPVTVATNIPFPITEASVGLPGWNPATNQFEAPFTALYWFSASVGSSENQTCTASIVYTTMTQSKRVASLTTDVEGDQGHFNSVLLFLERGNAVSVQLHPDGGMTYSSSSRILSVFVGAMMSNPGREI